MSELYCPRVRVDKRRVPIGIGYPADMPSDVREGCRDSIRMALKEGRSFNWVLARLAEKNAAVCLCYLGSNPQELRDGHDLPGHLKLIP